MADSNGVVNSVFTKITRTELRRLLTQALEEDIRTGDLTTDLLVPQDLIADAFLLAKDEGFLAGMEVFAEVFRLLDVDIEVRTLMRDGTAVAPGYIPVRLHGYAGAILKGERTALNFVQKMSGIATITAKFVAKAGPRLRVNHIRKTTPLLRALEVYAVRVGGGAYNRFGLDDGILIKDNHVVAAKKLGMGLQQIVARCRAGAPLTVKIGLEVHELAELPDALAAQPDYVALDNMSLEDIRASVAQVAGRIPVDVTGGVNLSNIAQIAETGADIVGVGAITHSAPSLDLSLELEFAS